MVGVLPLVKLGTLLVRTLSKPIASRLKNGAGNYPKFRQFILNVAQTNHRITTNMQRRIYGRSTNLEVRPLNEEKAVQVAADLIGELFIFSVAGSALIFEVHRNARSEARKEEIRKQEIEALKQKDNYLTGELETLKKKLNEVDQLLAKGRGLSEILNLKHVLASQSSIQEKRPT